MNVLNLVRIPIKHVTNDHISYESLTYINLSDFTNDSFLHFSDNPYLAYFNAPLHTVFRNTVFCVHRQDWYIVLLLFLIPSQYHSYTTFINEKEPSPAFFLQWNLIAWKLFFLESLKKKFICKTVCVLCLLMIGGLFRFPS